MGEELTPFTRISAWELELRGFFQPDRAMTLSYSPQWDDPYHPTAAVQLQARWEKDRTAVLYVDVMMQGYKPRTHLVELQQSSRGHVYFKCPISSKRVDALYYVRGQLGSRKVFGLTYPCQKVTCREYELLREDGLRPSDIGYTAMPRRPDMAGRSRVPRLTPLEEVLKFWEEQKRLGADRAAQAQLMNATDTRGALHRGAGSLYDHDEDRAHDLLSRAATVTLVSADQASTPLGAEFDMAIWEDQPLLDLRKLAAEGLLKRGERTCRRLNWRDPPELNAVYACLDLRDLQQPTAVLIFGSAVGAYRQVVALTPPPPTGRHRFRFMFAGAAPAEVLAYRHGRFAPRQLQRLINRSQRRSSPPRPILQAAA